MENGEKCTIEPASRFRRAKSAKPNFRNLFMKKLTLDRVRNSDHFY